MFDWLPVFDGARPVPAGDAGTRETVAMMQRLVFDAVASPMVRAYAVEIVRDELQRDWPGYVRALRRWLAERVRFVDDPVGVEWVTPPEILLGEIERRFATMADCDDVATLGAALAGALGMQSRFQVIGFKEHGPMRHVFAEVWNGEQWQDLDTTRPVGDASGEIHVARRWTVPALP